MYPKMRIDLDKIEINTKNVVNLCKPQGIGVMGVSKGVCADPEIVRRMIAAGVCWMGDSRIKNIKKLREADFDVPLFMLRIPMISEAREIAKWADGSFVSSFIVAESLSKAATALGKELKLILMVEMGDLREGLLQENLFSVAKQISELSGVELYGIGANFACYGGVIPEAKVLEQLVKMAEKIREELDIPLPIVSGGNSSSVYLLPDKLPHGITQLRLGEAILLGQEAIWRQPVAGSFQDAFILEAEVVEVETKPSLPEGKIGIDAFGRVPVFEDRGIRKRAIVAIGRQDTVPEDLKPCAEGVEILGASSDHMILDIEDAKEEIVIGDILSFQVRFYGALLQGQTSKYVEKFHI